jgi:hypothetical protein
LDDIPDTAGVHPKVSQTFLLSLPRAEVELLLSLLALCVIVLHIVEVLQIVESYLLTISPLRVREDRIGRNLLAAHNLPCTFEAPVACSDQQSY